MIAKKHIFSILFSFTVNSVIFPIFFKEGRFEDALQKFSTSLQVLGYNPHLSYNVALCYYRLKEYAPALKHICKFYGEIHTLFESYTTTVIITIVFWIYFESFLMNSVTYF
jgi:tetratricopeptide (TPR) repeat protein